MYTLSTASAMVAGNESVDSQATSLLPLKFHLESLVYRPLTLSLFAYHMRERLLQDSSSGCSKSKI